MLEYLTPPNLKDNARITVTCWSKLRSRILSLLIFNLSLLTSQCGLDIEDSTPPSPPVWVQKSLPEEWPERGIDASELGGIFLDWELNKDENIAAYLIYRAEYFDESDSLSDFNSISHIKVEGISESVYLDVEVLVGKAYCYKLKAEDVSGNMSTYGEPLKYRLLPAIYLSSLRPNGRDDKLYADKILSWYYNYNVEMENYCLTVLSFENELIFRRTFSPVNYVSGYESYHIPDSVVLNSNQRYRWRIDTAAQYVDGTETAGSESPWATFLYISG
jgi:hypothetical protein